VEYPFLYPGRKRDRVVDVLKKCYESAKQQNPGLTWVEPFVGGGGATLGVLPDRAILGDKYAELICVWQELQKGLVADPSLINDPECYESAKAEFNQLVPKFRSGSLSPELRSRLATLFCYLTATSWRGVWRTNAKGGFNVIFGNRKTPNLKTTQEFAVYPPLLRAWEFVAGDFRDVPVDDKDNVFLYADPPYEGTKSLYGAKFSKEDRLDLIEWAAQFPYAACSDAPVDWVMEAYRSRGFKAIVLQSPRGLGGRKGTPARVPELFAVKGDGMEEAVRGGVMEGFNGLDRRAVDLPDLRKNKRYKPKNEALQELKQKLSAPTSNDAPESSQEEESPEESSALAIFCQAVKDRCGIAVDPSTVAEGERYISVSISLGKEQRETVYTIDETKVVLSTPAYLSVTAGKATPHAIQVKEFPASTKTVTSRPSGLKKVNVTEKVLSTEKEEEVLWADPDWGAHFKAAQMKRAIQEIVPPFSPEGVYETLPKQLTGEEIVEGYCSLKPPIRIRRVVATPKGNGFALSTKILEQDYEIQEVPNASVSDREMTENMWGQD